MALAHWCTSSTESWLIDVVWNGCLAEAEVALNSFHLHLKAAAAAVVVGLAGVVLLLPALMSDVVGVDVTEVAAAESWAVVGTAATVVGGLFKEESWELEC
ncbi:hypothetical protein Moror_16975 [Moniliophthora roreri MCA 2997]|uniref:Uncharacterized protein n=1 Tax=Moniliophthora roreri (strain MCA 2997) TaxID=1381753 RepID=V2WBM0_MONRO|nr:hypothetical protein Moror_16975 [Moniliophthora roreri MCA 2997]